MAAAVNRVVELGGGIVVMDDSKVLGELQLQIAGIMSEAPLIEVNEALENAKEQAFQRCASRRAACSTSSISATCDLTL